MQIAQSQVQSLEKAKKALEEQLLDEQNMRNAVLGQRDDAMRQLGQLSEKVNCHFFVVSIEYRQETRSLCRSHNWKSIALRWKLDWQKRPKEAKS